MSDQADPNSRRIAWFAPWTWKRRWKIPATAWSALVAYPLSYGPAYWLFVRGWISDSAFYVMYLPICWIEERNASIYELVTWYGHLWLRHT